MFNKVLCFSLLGLCHCLMAEPSVTGYSKLFLIGYEEQKNAVAWSNRISVLESSDPLSIEASYQLAPVITNLKGTSATGLTHASSYRIDDLQPSLHNEGDTFSVPQNFDRLFVTYNNERATITCGRQQIAFGSSSFINPTDIFAPFIIATIDSEERAGVDAMRLRYFIGESEFDVALVFGEDAAEKNSAAYLRWIGPGSVGDLAATAARYRSSSLYGLDLQFQLAGIGLSWEAAYVKGIASDFVRMSLGGQYLFTDDWMISVNTHYNELGEQDKSLYPLLLTHADVIESQIFYLGEAYLQLAVAKAITPLVSASFSYNRNWFDRSGLMSSTIDWNLKEDQYLNLGAFIGVGDDTSEFGQFADIVYSSYRYYY